MYINIDSIYVIPYKHKKRKYHSTLYYILTPFIISIINKNNFIQLKRQKQKFKKKIDKILNFLINYNIELKLIN